MEDQKSSKRKFNTNFRKKLIETINKITKKEDIIYIFKIINNDIGSNFSENKSGIYFNMNLLSDNCIEKIVNYLNNNVDTISETSLKETKTILLSNFLILHVFSFPRYRILAFNWILVGSVPDIQ